MSLRMKALVLTVVAAVTGALAISATPASATPSQGYIVGTGDWTDDWWDEGPISTSSYAHSNVAAMWQSILWADGYLAWSGIDCWFGSGTAAATKSWQSAHGLAADGIVGPNTLKKASTWLISTGGSNYEYIGINGRYVTFVRNSNSRWGMYIGNDGHYLAYTYANFDVC